MSASLESHLGRFKPHERRRLMKETAVYAQTFCERIFGGPASRAQTGEEILGITVTRVKEGWAGYEFKDGDILFFYYLCRCCRKTILTLQNAGGDGIDAALPVENEDDTPIVLTETAALAFLQRRQSLDQFLAFIKEQRLKDGQRLKGKLRAYALGFPKYGAENRDVDQIARDLRITPPTVAKYRSRLREFLEDFEIQRARRNPA
jgi:hypothetical protein